MFSFIFNNIFRKYLYFLFLFFVFFPYLNLFSLPTDVQPFALIFSILLYFSFKQVLYFDEILLFFLVIFSFVLFFFEINFSSLRSFANYLSLFFIPVTTFRVLKSNRVDLHKFIIFSFLTWFVVSLVQTMIYSEFLTFLVNSAKSSSERGVTGLATEPSFLAIVFIFYILIFSLIPNFRFKNIFIGLAIFGVIFLARSSFGLIYLILIFAFYIFRNLSVKIIFYFFVSFIVGDILLFNFLYNSRIFQLYSIIKTNPFLLIYIDESVNDRFFQIFFSFKGFFDNWFLPNGFNYWEIYLKSVLPEYSHLLLKYFSKTGKIMSGLGSLFFEMGFIGLILPLVIFKRIFILFRGDFRTGFFYFLFIFLLMMSAINIGFPIFCFLIGYFMYLVDFQNSDKVIES
jgi:hypothetical protein